MNCLILYFLSDIRKKIVTLLIKKIIVFVALIITSQFSFAQFNLTGPDENYSGNYQINISADCGGLGGTYYLYENNALVRTQGCFYQNTDTYTASSKPTGTYNYRLDFCDIFLCLSEFGGEPTHTVNVNLNGPPPPSSTCVINNDPAYTIVVYYVDQYGYVRARQIRENWNVVHATDSNGYCQMEVVNYTTQGVAANRTPEVQDISNGGLRSRLLIPKDTYLPDCDLRNSNRNSFYCPINTSTSVALGVINYKATNSLGTVGAAGAWYAYFASTY